MIMRMMVTMLLSILGINGRDDNLSKVDNVWLLAYVLGPRICSLRDSVLKLGLPFGKIETR